MSKWNYAYMHTNDAGDVSLEVRLGSADTALFSVYKHDASGAIEGFSVAMDSETLQNFHAWLAQARAAIEDARTAAVLTEPTEEGTVGEG